MDIKIGNLHRSVTLWPESLRVQNEETLTVDKQKNPTESFLVSLHMKKMKLK